MRILLFFLLAFPTIAISQQQTPLISIWTSSGQCDWGCCRLEIRGNNSFIMAWIINTIDYGTYTTQGDTLELKVTHSRDYYEGDGTKEKSDKTWRFLVTENELIPFYYRVVVNGKSGVLISEIEARCPISFLKKQKQNRF